jgi:hypothetical protein
MNETSIHAVVAPIVPNETNTAVCSHRGTKRSDTRAANSMTKLSVVANSANRAPNRMLLGRSQQEETEGNCRL